MTSVRFGRLGGSVPVNVVTGAPSERVRPFRRLCVWLTMAWPRLSRVPNLVVTGCSLVISGKGKDLVWLVWTW